VQLVTQNSELHYWLGEMSCSILQWRTTQWPSPRFECAMTNHSTTYDWKLTCYFYSRRHLASRESKSIRMIHQKASVHATTPSISWRPSLARIQMLFHVFCLFRLDSCRPTAHLQISAVAAAADNSNYLSNKTATTSKTQRRHRKVTRWHQYPSSCLK